VHLESLRTKSSVSLRGQQLSLIYPVLAQSEAALLCGDFNFCSQWPEEQGPNITDHPLGRTFIDVWPFLHGPDNPGWTEDTEVNGMLSMGKKGVKQVRFDRVLIRSLCDHVPAGQPVTLRRVSVAGLRRGSSCLVRLVPRNMTILGRERIPPEEVLASEQVWPSDHFGLYSSYILLAASASHSS